MGVQRDMPLPNNASVNDSLESLDLSPRARVVLNAAGVKTLGQLRRKSDVDLFKMRNIGRSVIQEIRQRLLLPSVGMPIPRWSFDEQLRQGQAYDLIVRTEEHIRRYLERTLSKHYGKSWLRSGIPTAIQRKVIARGGTAKTAAAITDFLASLDFGDYKSVILHPPNWRLISSSKLKDHKRVAALLTEVNRFRRSVAHSRRLSETEYASLQVNVRRLTHAFSFRK